ncbi:hypothetical protein BDP55DRAFT_194977 [Colletotrichum godetiae]|uniref:Uncharacterized protein n=1 Tax=Colletotrichum godetiae TaxID=1209918 RepID=A0AAJ0AHH0_9PEZI|nr:uncharacterized protein BDP55DRAFT_194977 [Colletotrichum godetiae]KAK1673961.1 hypothetical protein BDP55DRAFT_194977 [Colletotrichum godetiae]
MWLELGLEFRAPTSHISNHSSHQPQPQFPLLTSNATLTTLLGCDAAPTHTSSSFPSPLRKPAPHSHLGAFQLQRNIKRLYPLPVTLSPGLCYVVSHDGSRCPGLVSSPALQPCLVAICFLSDSVTESGLNATSRNPPQSICVTRRRPRQQTPITSPKGQTLCVCICVCVCVCVCVCQPRHTVISHHTPSVVPQLCYIICSLRLLI